MKILYSNARQILWTAKMLLHFHLRKKKIFALFIAQFFKMSFNVTYNSEANTCEVDDGWKTFLNENA